MFKTLQELKEEMESNAPSDSNSPRYETKQKDLQKARSNRIIEKGE